MEIPRFLGQEPTKIIEEATVFLNSELSEGKPAYKALSLIRAFPRPIVVDFNNVITNNTDPMYLNPDAPTFLRELNKVGNIFIVTTSWNWKAVHEFLGENGVLSTDTILMAAQNFNFLSKATNHPQGIKLREQFQEMAQRKNFDVSENNLFRPLRYKRLAPIFKKPYLVPIIDDAEEATDNNPGMLGIQVQEWEPNYTGEAREEANIYNEGKATLMDAVEIVKNHYISLGGSSRTSDAIR